MGRLQDCIIVIVGGTSGMGLSAARACVQEGARVVVAGRSGDKAEAAASELGENCRSVVGDAAQPETSARCVETAVDAFGRLDGLYHVAGVSGRRWGDGPLHEIPDEGWELTLRTNLSSVFYSNRAAIGYWLKEERGGSILNMASVLGYSPSPRHFSTHAYGVSKAGIIGLTRTAAATYAPYDIRVNAIAPALVETPMAGRAAGDPEIQSFIRTKQPLDGGRIGRPEDLDEAVVYLLSDASRFVTGQVLAVDGGWTVSEGRGNERSDDEGVVRGDDEGNDEER